MCDYSLENVKSRPAKIGDKITTRRFNLSTIGFSAPEDRRVAVCLLPGTELSFAHEVRGARLWPWSRNVIHHHKTAIFRQLNLNKSYAHHDALEFPDGEVVLLADPVKGQQATVLQLPAVAIASEAPRRAAYVLSSSESRKALSNLFGIPAGRN